MTTTILNGDCRKVLATLADGSVDCCVTSPPYFGLRDYGMADQIGLEQTPAAFVEELVTVFREVRRVLRYDGTLWLNLGDSYWSGSATIGRNDAGKDIGGRGGNREGSGNPGLQGTRARAAEGFKAKDLIGIPWRVAFALQADGWYLRQDIIWSKPNPMPESVTDRCTKAHEYLFLLSKSANYFCDMDSIKEKSTGQLAGNVRPAKGAQAYIDGDDLQRTKAGLSAFADRQRSKRDSFKREDAKRGEPIVGQSAGTHRPDRDESDWPLDTRNKRSVWTVATQPYKEAHFATFPPALIEPCVMAGCPPGGTVLDPFFGAGTTGLVADRLQRDCIGIELNPAYVEIASKRITGDSPLFSEVL